MKPWKYVRPPKGMGTIEDLAKAVRISTRTLRRWRARGVFPVAKIHNSTTVFYDMEESLKLIRAYRAFQAYKWSSRHPGATIARGGRKSV